jgi:hypothetical protein
MEFVPTGSEVVVSVATPEERVPVPSVVEPLENVMDCPLALPVALSLAVSVIVDPAVVLDGVALKLSVDADPSVDPTGSRRISTGSSATFKLICWPDEV